MGVDDTARRRHGHRSALGAAGPGPGGSAGRRLPAAEPARERDDELGCPRYGRGLGGKVFGTELTQQVARELLEVVGQAGVRKDSAAPLKGELESAYRLAVINTFGGGANELQRDIIAMAGLGMPRAPRDVRASGKEKST